MFPVFPAGFWTRNTPEGYVSGVSGVSGGEPAERSLETLLAD